MSVAAAPSSRSSTNVRPSLSHFQPGSLLASPHTPNRGLSSSFSSPSAAGKSEDDAVILEFGARSLRAGFAGDSSPLCCLRFGVSEQQRAGDYRQWEPGYGRQLRESRAGKLECETAELWHMDLRKVDLGLVEDKIERAVRQVFTKHLTTESKSRRVLLVLPPALPHAFLSILLTTLFGTCQSPTITILSAPVLSAVAAGVRSALVIDIGWSETVITGVFEYREINWCRSVRAGKLLLQQMNAFLVKELEKARKESRALKSNDLKDEFATYVSFEETEDVQTRFAWCRNFSKLKGSADQNDLNSPTDDKVQNSDTILVPLQSPEPPVTLEIPFSTFAEPTEAALFAHEEGDDGFPDDEELPLGLLAYRALLSLPIDARAVCMSRIMVVGGGSHIPGIKRRIIDEVAALVAERGWEKVSRRKLANSKRNLDRTPVAEKAAHVSDSGPELQSATKSDDVNGIMQYPASAEFEADTITKELSRIKAKGSKPFTQGVVRGIESLGPWAGASIVANLKVKGVVEIEKDRFLQQGLSGGSRGVEPSVVPRETGFGSGTTKTGTGDRSSWTLGVWA